MATWIDELKAGETVTLRIFGHTENTSAMAWKRNWNATTVEITPDQARAILAILQPGEEEQDAKDKVPTL